MPHDSGKLRLSVQAKVLLVVLGFLVLLPALMVWIVDRQTNQLVLQQEKQALSTAHAGPAEVTRDPGAQPTGGVSQCRGRAEFQGGGDADAG